MTPVDSILSFSPEHVATPLLLAVVVAGAALLARGSLAPYLARIGLRNAPRRFGRTALIVLGLMLATSFIASALAIDDTITLAVQSVAVFNLGRVDEDVTGGRGPLGLYPDWVGTSVERALSKDALVADVAPSLVAPGALVADTTSRAIRGGVNALGVESSQGAVFGDLRDVRTGDMRSALAMAASDADISQSLALALNARVGDQVTLYSALWPGQRFSFTVRAIVTGGPLGDAPSIILRAATLQAMTGAAGSINHIYIANAGNGLTGVGLSDSVATDVETATPGFVHVSEVKLNGVKFAVRAQELFGRVLTLYTLFALAIGVLLIFLIFSLLAAERRAEMGVARALGMRRGHVVWTLVFEGAAYDLAAAALGVVAGLALGSLVLYLASPTLTRIGFPLRFALNPDSVIVAFALGLLCTLLTIGVAAWFMSRMTIAAALRDLPEPPAPEPALRDRVREAIAPGVAFHARLAPISALLWLLVARGVAPLIAGYALARLGVARTDALSFAAGVSLMLTGATLLARALALAGVTVLVKRLWPASVLLRMSRARDVADRLSALVIGGGLALYWSLPFDALVGVFGLPRFNGGIQIFFIAGVLMVTGCVLALAPNLDLALAPLRAIGSLPGWLRHITRVALLYPAQQRFRTGVGLALFAFTLFTMVVIDCIAASTTRNYDDVPAQTASYDIIGQPLFRAAGDVAQVTQTLRRVSPQTASHISATSEATPVPVGLIEPAAANAAWRYYPASIIQGALLDGVGMTLAARATGFTSDAQVWEAVRNHPGDVIVDSSALSAADTAILGLTPAPPPGPAQFLGPPIAAGLPGFTGSESLQAQAAALQASGAGAAEQTSHGSLSLLTVLLNNQGALRDETLRLSALALGPGRIAPTTVWAVDLRGSPAAKLTVVGVIENSRGATYGLMGSPQTFAPVELGQPAMGSDYYYFKLRPGADPRATGYAIGSALMNDGFETAVLQDALLDVNGARVFISQALVGLVGLTLLVGMAALAVTGSRAVIERRQQIGMLRALGYHRLGVQVNFLIESLVVGVSGAILGVVFGLLLCHNIFAVDFFEQYQTGLSLIVPWRDIGGIIVAAVLASLIAAVLPAWQAGRVTPADALRYE